MKTPIEPQAVGYSFQQGNVEAFNRLAVEHQDDAYTLAYYLLGDETAAVEAVESAFNQAYDALHKFRFSNFLLNRHASLRTWLLGWVVKACEGQPHAAVATGKGRAGELCRQLHQLAPECRLALILVDFLGMEYKEAASAGSIRLPEVKSCLARARAGLGQIHINA